jgi:hypothetical protein
MSTPLAPAANGPQDVDVVAHTHWDREWYLPRETTLLRLQAVMAQVLDAVGARELLDYGAGKGRLGETLRQHASVPLTIHHYDPAITRWSAPPQPCGFVACIDVLEHIEPGLLDNVLDDLQRVTAGYGVFTVHTGAAAKVLLDGRNAHLIQQPASWWLPKFIARFELVQFSRMPQGFWVSVQKLAA